MATRPPNIPGLQGTGLGIPGTVATAVPGRISFASDPIQDTPAVSAEQARKDKAENFLRLARERWQTMDTADKDRREDEKECLDFFASDQWPRKIKAQRELDGRPCLTVNRLPGFVRQLTNEMRDGRPGIEIVPVDSGADVALAEVYQGLIQHIEANSDADVAYARAAEAQVRTGRGYFRIVPEYASDTGFEQELKIKSIRNPHTIYFDHASQEFDGSDARYAFIVEDLPRDEYDARFGKETRGGLEQWSRPGETIKDWAPQGKVRVAEYYCFVPKQRRVVQLQNGVVLDGDEINTPVAQMMLQQYKVVQERMVDGRQLTWALINGAEILDGNEDKTAGREMPGRWIPIIPVLGEEIDRDGAVEYRGIIKDAIGSQRMSNVWKSATTEAVALAPKTPFVAEEGQLEGHQDEWAQANVRNFAVLLYKAKALDGHLVGAPQRQVAETPIQAMMMLSREAENDLRATAGFSYDVGAQEKRLEQSGRAILARQKQGEMGNSHFAAHLAVALRHAGRILLDLIPKYYDTPRVKRILGRDGQFKQVLLHAGNPEAAQLEAQRQGLAETQIHDLSAGRYDVRVTAGVSYASQRQQDREMMVNALQTNPQLMTLIGDLFFKTLDSPISERIAKRLAKALPPGLQDEDESKPPPIPPQLQQQMRQAQQLIDHLTKAVDDLTDQITSKHEDNATKIRLAQIQAETTVAVAESKIITEQSLALLDARMRGIEQTIKIDLARLDAAQAALAAPASASTPAAAPPPASPTVPSSPESPIPAPGASAPMSGDWNDQLPVPAG